MSQKNSCAAATFSGSIDETTCVPFRRLFVTASSQPFLIVKDVVHAQNIQRIYCLFSSRGGNVRHGSCSCVWCTSSAISTKVRSFVIYPQLCSIDSIRPFL